MSKVNHLSYNIYFIQFFLIRLRNGIKYCRVVELPEVSLSFYFSQILNNNRRFIRNIQTLEIIIIQDVIHRYLLKSFLEI